MIRLYNKKLPFAIHIYVTESCLNKLILRESVGCACKLFHRNTTTCILAKKIFHEHQCDFAVQAVSYMTCRQYNTKRRGDAWHCMGTNCAGRLKFYVGSEQRMRTSLLLNFHRVELVAEPASDLVTPPTALYTDSSHQTVYCTLRRKNDTHVAHYNFNARQPISVIVLAETLLREYAVEWRSVFAPHLTTVSALPGDTRKRENRAFRFARVQPVAAWFLPYCWLATFTHDAVWLHKSCTVIIDFISGLLGHDCRRSEVLNIEQ